MKIIQITAVRTTVGTADVEPAVFGLGDDGKVYRWEYTESKWSFMGNNPALDPYRG